MNPERLHPVLERLSAHYGPMHWWPGETPFEVMVGAILTQNTAWTNVERAIANLKAAEVLDAESLAALSRNDLAGLIRPSGYFNVKAGRLQAFCCWYLEQGGETALRGWSTEALRRGLLSVKGVGPETADDILLYAFERPVFVVDAYTRRLFARLELAGGDEPYDVLRTGVEAVLGEDVPALNEFHALIVAHGKTFCRPRPRCESCPLRAMCQASLRFCPVV
ncbi:endonuclease III domain-containing protein [Ectothiorhodospira lacustris]|uniref:endonuclease III domain-containing protein n=1 Tax=Ectothiorhodospira lacustris TaxID=2899127 RepID=UPI003D31544D